ncbi:TniQ family protein [Streptomyces sp. NPDC059070]|uniref:TniQ family protein n=1 Tax=Streptomyces sp. NPDC059070 TaxID=3346713 RepID=UPI00367884D7
MTGTTATSQTLPRSLLPLPDESLTGYLLRLSHRLDESPLRLAARTGLISPQDFSRHAGRVRQPTMTDLPDDLAQPFAAAVRLAPAAVRDLTLMSYQQTYPPVAAEIHRRQFKPRSGPRTAWFSSTAAKCCPRCLAGDRSTIQQLHGGPWKRQWHLPVVFACLEHNTLLHDTCPHCHRPIHANGYVSPFLRMVHGASTAELHPGRCRNTIGPGKLCQGRLDQLTPFCNQQLPQLTPQTAALQRRLLDQLNPRSNSPKPFQRFADLLVLAALVTQAWPRRPDLPTPPELVEALNMHVEQQKAQIGPRAARGTLASQSMSWAAAPQSAAATAAILAMADHCQHSSTRELRDILGSLLNRSAERRHPRWGQIWKQMEHCSESFRNELAHALARRFPPSTPWQDFLGTLISQPPHGYWADHVPQELPVNWFKQYFPCVDRLPPPSVHALRRTAALQLVQAVTGGSPREAARFLGVPAAWLSHGGWVMSPEVMRRAAADFDVTDALQDLAQHLANLPAKVNYRERREQFATWHLPHDQWEALLAATGTTPRGCSPLLNRNVTSAYIWAKVTGSEWTLAPIMRESAADASWARRSGPTATGMRCLTTGMSRQATLLAETADALAQALASPAPDYKQSLSASPSRRLRQAETAN